MTDPFSDYQIALNRRLLSLGMSHEETLEAREKIKAFDPDIRVERWSKGCSSFLFSKGCSKYPGSGQEWRDEFLIEDGAHDTFNFKLLIFTIYYHLTLRPILPADVIPIGEVAENAFGYSHVYVSVPFFFPGSVNVISVANIKFSLNWLMPIYKREAEFIHTHGAELFEKKLSHSRYDYFDVRTDLNYLEN